MKMRDVLTLSDVRCLKSDVRWWCQIGLHPPCPLSRQGMWPGGSGGTQWEEAPVDTILQGTQNIVKCEVNVATCIILNVLSNAAN